MGAERGDGDARARRDPSRPLGSVGARRVTRPPVHRLVVLLVTVMLATAGTFAYIERQVDIDVAQHVADLHLPGIGLLPVAKRYYPAGPVAPQVLGFVNVDGVGTTGLERQYEQLLAGSPGKRTVELSAQGQEIAGGRQIVQDPQPGSSVVLTIDRDLQFQAQEYLRTAVQQNHAKGGTIVVL